MHNQLTFISTLRFALTLNVGVRIIDPDFIIDEDLALEDFIQDVDVFIEGMDQIH